MGFFGGLIFGPGIFLGFCWKPKGFFWVLFFGSIRSSPSLEIPSTPPGVLSDYKTAFTCTPALNQSLSENSSCKQFQIQRYQEYHELNTLAEFGHEKCEFTTAENRKKLGTMLPQGSK